MGTYKEEGGVPDPLNIRIGPEALVAASKRQREQMVTLWEQGLGIRVWLDGKLLRYELGNGQTGVI